MPGSSSWMPYAPQGVKGFGDDDDICNHIVPVHVVTLRLHWHSNQTMQGDG